MLSFASRDSVCKYICHWQAYSDYMYHWQANSDRVVGMCLCACTGLHARTHIYSFVCGCTRESHTHGRGPGVLGVSLGGVFSLQEGVFSSNVIFETPVCISESSPSSTSPFLTPSLSSDLFSTTPQWRSSEFLDETGVLVQQGSRIGGLQVSARIVHVESPMHSSLNPNVIARCLSPKAVSCQRI